MKKKTLYAKYCEILLVIYNNSEYVLWVSPKLLPDQVLGQYL